MQPQATATTAPTLTPGQVQPSHRLQAAGPGTVNRASPRPQPLTQWAQGGTAGRWPSPHGTGPCDAAAPARPRPVARTLPSLQGKQPVLLGWRVTGCRATSHCTGPARPRAAPVVCDTAGLWDREEAGTEPQHLPLAATRVGVEAGMIGGETQALEDAGSLVSYPHHQAPARGP